MEKGGLCSNVCLDYKCDILGKAFKYSGEDGYDSFNFIRSFMTSPKSDRLFITDDCQTWSDSAFLYSEIKHTLGKKALFKNNHTLDEFELWFMGYLYKYWYNNSKLSRYEIYEILPVERFHESFGYYHTLGWETVIKEATDLYKSGNYII